jgi:hypothetical protein
MVLELREHSETGERKILLWLVETEKMNKELNSEVVKC